MNWTVGALAGAYTALVFVAGAFFGRWVWIRITEPKVRDDGAKRAIAEAVRITERYEP